MCILKISMNKLLDPSSAPSAYQCSYLVLKTCVSMCASIKQYLKEN